jgi:DNA-binding MarR family transcriptional regulator
MTSARVDAHLVQLLAQAERRVTARIAETLEAKGSSLEQWRVLCVLAERDGSPMNEIAAYAMLPSPTLTKVADRMVAANLVHRRADDRDRRRVLVFLTSRGRDLCRTLTHEVSRHETELASPGFDRQRLAELLSQLINGAE